MITVRKGPVKKMRRLCAMIKENPNKYLKPQFRGENHPLLKGTGIGGEAAEKDKRFETRKSALKVRSKTINRVIDEMYADGYF